MLPHSLTNYEIQKCYQNEPEFNVVYSRNNLSKIKDRTFIINLYKYESIGAHWIALYLNAENVTYFDSYFDKKILISYFDKKIFKEEDSIDILKSLGLTANIEEYQEYIIMSKENISQEFTLGNIDETRNYLIEEINQNE